MKYTTTISATGVEMPSSTVLSTTCPEACTVPLPGGSPGAATKTTSGVAITLATTHHSTTRRQWLTSFIVGRASYDVDEAVHVADGLHRSAPALDESRRARNEALPAIEAATGGAERERGGGVGEAERARRVAARILGGVGDPHEWDREADFRDREHVRGRGGVDRLCRLAVEYEVAASRAGRLGDELVAEPRLRVELIDRDAHERVGGKRVGRHMTPVPSVGIDRVIGHPGGMRVVERGSRNCSEVQLRPGRGLSRGGRSRRIGQVEPDIEAECCANDCRAERDPH